MFIGIENGVAVAVSEHDFTSNFDGEVVQGVASVGDLYSNGVFTKDNNVKIAAIKLNVSSHIDAQAQTEGFDNILTAVTYADEPKTARYQVKGKKLRAWRSDCWDVSELMLEAWLAGGDEPTSAEVIAALPVY